MSSIDRFAAFLRREGASYHAPPPTPSDAMWPDVSARMDAGAYNAPPPAPREEMWERIEAAWTSGPSMGSAAAKLAADHAAAPLVTTEPTGDPGRLPGPVTTEADWYGMGGGTGCGCLVGVGADAGPELRRPWGWGNGRASGRSRRHDTGAECPSSGCRARGSRRIRDGRRAGNRAARGPAWIRTRSCCRGCRDRRVRCHSGAR